jgi:pantetheine-phosphate adenylyltransferase
VPRLALFPGSFDPVTRGHLDVLRRALALFDRVEAVVGLNSSRTPLFSAEERVGLIRACTAAWPEADRLGVASFSGLLADYARERGAVALVRGVRGVGDFDYEMRLAVANRQLAPVETVFIVPAPEYSAVSATIVRDVHRHGGDVSAFVAEPVERALAAKGRPA